MDEIFHQYQALPDDAARARFLLTLPDAAFLAVAGKLPLWSGDQTNPLTLYAAMRSAALQAVREPDGRLPAHLRLGLKSARRRLARMATS